MVIHPIPPEFNNSSAILILGSFPSVKSREQMFYYGHPQNRFWRVISSVFSSPVPTNDEEKKALLHKNKIALWDVIHSCDITGSADSTISNVVPNNLNIILSSANIKEIYVNGKAAYKYYNKYIKNTVNRNAILLPSTSPANAAWSLEMLVKEWGDKLKI